MYPKNLSAYGPVPPIGLAYIAAVLRDAGHLVSVVDGAGSAIDRYEDFDTSVGTMRRVGLSPAEIVEELAGDVEVIGITNMFLNEWPQVREIAELARKRIPAATIIAGGENATAFREWIFRECPAIDHIVLGEGEATTLGVVERIGAGVAVEGSDGVASRRSGDEAVRDADLPVRLRKIDSLPRPAWDLFPIEDYLEHPFFGVNRGRSMPVLATRGCPYRCTFCSSPQMWTTRYVVRDPAEVAQEIADYVRRWDLQNINFCDLTAITKRKWTLQFCDELEKHNLDITWQLPVGTRSEALDAEVLQRLWDTGCRNITYAPESGSKRMLDIFDKRIDLDKMLESLTEAHRLGLRTHVNVIIGHPQEHWRDLVQTYKLLMKAAWRGCDDAAAIMFCPYPGSTDFSDLVERGRVQVDEDYYYVNLTRASGQHVSYDPRMSASALRLAQLATMLSFYALAVLRRPRRIPDFLIALRSGRETTTAEQMLRNRRSVATRRRRRKPAVAMASST